MNKIRFQIATFFLFTTIGFSQPYTDIASFTYQHFSSDYKNNPNLRNQTDNYQLNLFYPKVFKNGNVFLLRFNTEMLHSSTNLASDNSSNLSSFSLPIGFQWVSKSKRWKTVLMGIPKLASNFEGAIVSKDWQYGGLFLEDYSPSEKLKLKAGLYYNREAFGNFFVPLLGVDWKATDRIYLYGILPNSYKIEYSIIKDKFFTGLDLKSGYRSFNLSNTTQHNYVRFDETLAKFFLEGFVAKNLLLSGEVGYSFGKSPQQYYSDTNELNETNIIYTPLKKSPVFNIGISYRIRNEERKQ